MFGLVMWPDAGSVALDRCGAMAGARRHAPHALRPQLSPATRRGPLCAARPCVVVCADDLCDGAVARDAPDHASALRRMLLHDDPVFVGEATIGEQDPVREDELADVVEQTGRVDELLLTFCAADLRRNRLRVASD